MLKGLAMAMAMAMERSKCPVSTSWPVMMAQFVPLPSEEAMAKAPSFFFKKRRLPTGFGTGTWLKSKDMATITLSSNSSSSSGYSNFLSSPSIALILQGNVHEEHLLSSLAFAWPAVPDSNGESSSPDRVIFASYIRTETNTKHKFAMQFETVLQAEWFFQTIKQLVSESICSQDSENTGQNINSNLITGNVNQMDAFKRSCLDQSDPTVTNHETTKESSHQTIIRRSSTPSSKDTVSDLSSNVTLQSQVWPEGKSNLGGERDLRLFSLPPRFPPPELEQHAFGGNSNNSKRKSELRGPDTPLDDLRKEQVLREKVMDCFLDPDFQGFVDHVEKVWQAMEDELATEISSIDP